jgi:chromate transporter
LNTELFRVFLKLGLIGFGGPAALIAMMQDEVVERRKWLTRERFLELVGMTNLIPGPNAVQVSLLLGLLRAGWRGCLVAGLCFILPATLISLAFAWMYVELGAVANVQPLLVGIKPAVLAILAASIARLGITAAKIRTGTGSATGRLGRSISVAFRSAKGAAFAERKATHTEANSQPIRSAAVEAEPPSIAAPVPVFTAKSLSLIAIGLLVVVLAAVGINEVLAMFSGALLGMFWLRTMPTEPTAAAALTPAAFVGNACASGSSGKALILGAASGSGLLAAATAAPPLWQLGLFFLKVGAVLYGGGYVLVAFLDGGLVEQHHWLSREQLLDAIAVGQITPGPLLSTVTFIGYLLGRLPGACVATVAVFLPSFGFVAALHRLLPRIRRSPWAAAFLDAVNISAVALMVVVAVRLGTQALTYWWSWAIFAAAMIAGLAWKANPAWLVLAGAIAGWGLG